MGKLFFCTLALAISLARVAEADDQADAKAILDAAIKAHGGEAALGKAVGIYFKMKGTSYDEDNKPTPLSGEWFIQGNDKERLVSYDADNKVDEIEVVNGNDGWVKDADQPTEKMSSEQSESRREMIYLNWVTMFFPLKADGFRLAPIDETSVAGRKAEGILVSHDKHGTVRLYFDKETHLLVKYERKYKNVDVGKEVDEECLYTDYRDVQDTKQPFKVETLWDGKKTCDLVIAEIKFYEKPLDEKLFVKP